MILLLLAAAHAADWLAIQGTEPPDSAFRGLGFLQVSAEGILSDPVEGLSAEGLAAYEGERAAFNVVNADGSPWAMTLRRARVGGRGEVPRTDGMVSANLAIELGQNPLTIAGSAWSPHVMDASLTLHPAADFHVRVGQFKLPLSDEVLEAVHITSDLIRATPVTGRLLMERDATSGAYSGVVNGFRDAGVQAFGSHLLGDVEIAWAAMGSVGSVDIAATTPQPTGTARLQLSHLPSPGLRRHPSRPETSVWGFAHTGQRTVGELSAQRTRLGAGAQLQRAGGRLRAEGIWAQGVLNVGMSPPFPGGSIQVDPDGRAWGVTGLATARLAERWELGVSYAHLDSRPDAGADRRLFDEVTGIAQLHLSPTAWIDLNVAWRDGRAPEGSADAQLILDSFGPYGGLMFTARR